MRKFIIFILLFFISESVFSKQTFILNETYINTIYNDVQSELAHCENVEILKDVRGIIIRIRCDNLAENFKTISPHLEKQLNCVEYFLAKIKNPVIIEVHAEKIPENLGIRNWEYTSVIAGKIGETFLKNSPTISVDRIHTVGYGEFMPAINTSNNGSNSYDRIDIIILSSLNGE